MVTSITYKLIDVYDMKYLLKVFDDISMLSPLQKILYVANVIIKLL
ncbi:MAG: hypothetical protein RMX97_16425 [Nostoc sp. DedQUE11]|nr:hypothetical protein [Nostoc sp. DedQUE11]